MLKMMKIKLKISFICNNFRKIFILEYFNIKRNENSHSAIYERNSIFENK